MSGSNICIKANCKEIQGEYQWLACYSYGSYDGEIAEIVGRSWLSEVWLVCTRVEGEGAEGEV